MNKTVFVDYRIYEESVEKLIELGYNTIKIQGKSYFDEPICAHPDMSIVKVKDKLFISSDSDDIMLHLDKQIVEEHMFFSGEGKKLKYPNDISLNCAVVGNNIICNKKHTATEILDYASQIGMKIINVNQGYAKCSTCIVSDNAIITEDQNIAEQAIKNNIDVLIIQKGYVKLDGYDYGFIGGCCGLLDNKVLVFNGNISQHPDYDSIKVFCEKHKVHLTSLCNLPLYDVGSIVQI